MNITMNVLLKEITCEDIKILPNKEPGLINSTNDVNFSVHIKQESWGNITTITIQDIVTLEKTGEKCSIKSSSIFELHTNFDILRNITHQLTLSLYGELALLTTSHLRVFFIEKAKNTKFKNIIVPYVCYNDTVGIIRKVLLAQFN